jgi:hypothetical protein
VVLLDRGGPRVEAVGQLQEIVGHGGSLPAGGCLRNSNVF